MSLTLPFGRWSLEHGKKLSFGSMGTICGGTLSIADPAASGASFYTALEKGL